MVSLDGCGTLDRDIGFKVLIASFISRGTKISFLVVGERSLFNLRLCYD